MLAHRQNTSMNLRSFISSCSYVTSTKLQYGYVVFAVVLYLVGLLHASTPEFKRGGVYLSGDVILGKIIFTTFKCISIIFEYNIHILLNVNYLLLYFNIFRRSLSCAQAISRQGQGLQQQSLYQRNSAFGSNVVCCWWNKQRSNIVEVISILFLSKFSYLSNYKLHQFSDVFYPSKIKSYTINMT